MPTFPAFVTLRNMVEVVPNRLVEDATARIKGVMDPNGFWTARFAKGVVVPMPTLPSV